MLYLILYIIKEVHVVKTHLINSHQTSTNTYHMELNYTCGTCNIKQEHVFYMYTYIIIKCMAQ